MNSVFAKIVDSNQLGWCEVHIIQENLTSADKMTCTPLFSRLPSGVSQLSRLRAT